MATGLLVVGRLKGIERPALAPMMPTMDDMACLRLIWCQYGCQAGAFASICDYGQHLSSEGEWHLSKPRVGLLNVGTEDDERQ